MAESNNDWQQLAYAEQLLDEAKYRDDEEAEGDARVLLGRSCAVLGLTAEAVHSFEQAIPIYKKFHSQVEVGRVLLELGSSLYRIEYFDRALIILEEALVIAKQTPFGHLLLDCLCQFGLVSMEEGHLHKAISCHQEALAIVRINNDREAEMHTLDNLGGAYTKYGSSYEAIFCYELEFRIALELGNVESQALALGHIGCAYTDRFECPEAGIFYFEQAFNLFCSVCDQYNQAKLLANIGDAYWKMKHALLALHFLGRAKDLATEQGDRGLLGGILSRSGIIYSALGQHDDAFHAYQQALLLDQGRGNRHAEEQHLNNLGLLQQATGHPEEALLLHRKALMIARERKDLLEEARQFGCIAVTLTLLGNIEDGLLHNKQALTIFQALGNILDEGHIYTNIGMAYVNLKRSATHAGRLHIRGNKGKALAYWRMGQLLLKTIHQAENGMGQQKIDSLKDAAHEKTFQRWWRSSETHLCWLIFQRYWINKNMFLLGNKNDDLLFYARDIDDCVTFNNQYSERAWLQGDITVQEENWRDALLYYQQALTIECKRGRPDTQALLLGNLGCSCAKIGNYEEGIIYLQQSLELFRFLDNTNNIIKTLLNLGTLQLQSNVLTEARAYFDMALNLADMYEDRLFDSIALRKMSDVYRVCNKTYEAKSFLTYALEVANIHGDKQEEGKLLISSGFICMELGQPYKAISYFQRARDLYQTLRDSQCEAEQWCFLAIAYAMQGKFDIALDNFSQAQKIFHYYNYQLGESQIDVYMGVAYALQGHLPFFIAYLRRALDLVGVWDAEAQRRIQHMLEQVKWSTERELFQQIWRDSTCYYQALC